MLSSKKPKITGAIIFFLILMVFIVFTNGKNNLVENIFNTSVSPFARFFSGMGFWLNDKIYFFSSIGELKQNNKKLTKENLELQAKLADLNNTEKENEQLRKELGLAPKGKYELEAALINGKDLTSNQDRVYINKGQNKGLKKDMPVIIGNGVMVGKIIEVFHNQAIVELVFSQKSFINVELPDGEKGIVHGEYGTSVVLDMVSQSAQLENQEQIVTSGLGEKTPRGLLIGYVKDILPTSDQLFQKTSVNLPYEIEKTRMVWVLKSVKE